MKRLVIYDVSRKRWTGSPGQGWEKIDEYTARNYPVPQQPNQNREMTFGGEDPPWKRVIDKRDPRSFVRKGNWEDWIPRSDTDRGEGRGMGLDTFIRVMIQGSPRVKHGRKGRPWDSLCRQKP